MKTLRINIKKELFNMILSNQQKEKYLDIKNFWGVRLLDFKEEIEYAIFDELLNDLKYCANSEDINSLLQHYDCKFRQFDTVLFINGMKEKEKSKRFEIEFKGIDVSCGIEEYGAIDKRNYFIIKLGEILWSQNC